MLQPPHTQTESPSSRLDLLVLWGAIGLIPATTSRAAVRLRWSSHPQHPISLQFYCCQCLLALESTPTAANQGQASVTSSQLLQNFLTSLWLLDMFSSEHSKKGNDRIAYSERANFVFPRTSSVSESTDGPALRLYPWTFKKK